MERFANFIVSRRRLVLAATLLITLVLGLQLRNLSVIVDADELLPRDHPFVEVTERVQAVFGNRYTVVIGITANTGDGWQPEVLGKLLAVTDRLAATPGVTRDDHARYLAAGLDAVIVKPLVLEGGLPATLARAATRESLGV